MRGRNTLAFPRVGYVFAPRRGGQVRRLRLALEAVAFGVILVALAVTNRIPVPPAPNGFGRP